jgi:cysteinyl-tRNA synthetase
MHGGGMDLLFPHHENELAQSESATGKPFVKYWLHNGLTKIRTKARGGEAHSEDMHESAGNAVRVKPLIEKHGAELIRYMLLMTHYRRPIDFSDEVMVAARKGYSTFQRLFERVDRLQAAKDTGGPSQEIADVANLKTKFLEMMDDDFNTAGAIGVLYELAGAINGFIESSRVERDKQPDALRAVAGATQTLRELGGLLGLFRRDLKAQSSGAEAAGGETLEKVMGLLIQLRNDARKDKNFKLADGIRNGLTSIGITLEDRSDGTIWRKS